MARRLSMSSFKTLGACGPPPVPDPNKPPPGVCLPSEPNSPACLPPYEERGRLGDAIWDPPQSVCPNPTYPGDPRECTAIGRGFFLPDTKLDPTTFESAAVRPKLLVNTTLNTPTQRGVVMAANSGTGQVETRFSNTTSTSDRVNSSANKATGGVDVKGGAYEMSANFEYETGYSAKTHKNVFTSDFETFRENGVVTLSFESITWDNLDPTFKAAFQSLSTFTPTAGRVISATDVDEYIAFIKRWGSHVLIKEHVGRKYRRLYSSSENSADVARSVKAKACAEASASFGINSGKVQGCDEFTQSDIDKAYTLNINGRTFAWGGGSVGAQLASIANADNCPPPDGMLFDFLQSPLIDDKGIAWEFEPIWDFLRRFYQVDRNLLITLKMVYDYFLKNKALGYDSCDVQYLPVASTNVVRGVKAKVDPNTNSLTYGCWHVRDGCDSNAACKWRNGGVSSKNEAECTMEGGGNCFEWDNVAKRVKYRQYWKNGGCSPKGPGDCPWYEQACWGDWNHDANCSNTNADGWEDYSDLQCVNPQGC